MRSTKGTGVFVWTEIIRVGRGLLLLFAKDIIFLTLYDTKGDQWSLDLQRLMYSLAKETTLMGFIRLYHEIYLLFSCFELTVLS